MKSRSKSDAKVPMPMPNWAIVLGGALLSTLSFRLGYKFRQALDAAIENVSCEGEEEAASCEGEGEAASCEGGEVAASYDLEVEGTIRGVRAVYHENFPSDITIGQLKERILTMFGESQGIYNNLSRVADPELYALAVFDWDGFPFSPICKDDTQSLRNYLSDVGYFSAPMWKYTNPFPIKVHIVLECTWYQLEEAYAKYKKSSSEDYEDVYRDYTTCHGDFSGSDSDDDVDSNLEDILDRQRPWKTLVCNKDVLRVTGRLHIEARLDNGTIKRRRVAYIGGLGCDLKDVVKMTTTAKHVILVFTSYNFFVLSCYHGYLDDDIDNDPDDSILVLLVTWDKFSYLLLRKLRKDIGPDVPIIAITESNLHELDLLAFLDTPPSQVISLYGYEDLSRDCAALDVMDVAVDIKWAGLRPSETLNQTFAPATRPFSIDTRYYRMVCKHLERHPKLLGKPKWLQELDLFREHPVYLRLESAGLTNSDVPFTGYFREKYFPNKLANEDWI